ncbi:hypothetical protein Tco_1302159, partial [Tanacetum coccineum]
MNLLLIIRAKEKGRRDFDGNLEEGLRRVGFELMESKIKDLAYGQFLKASGEECITTKRSSSMDEEESAISALNYSGAVLGSYQ